MYNLFSAFAAEVLKWDTFLLPHVLADTRCLTQDIRRHLSLWTAAKRRPRTWSWTGSNRSFHYLQCLPHTFQLRYCIPRHKCLQETPSLWSCFPLPRPLFSFYYPISSESAIFCALLSESVYTTSKTSRRLLPVRCTRANPSAWAALTGSLGGLGAAEMNDWWLGVQMEPVYAQNAINIWAANSIKLSETWRQLKATVVQWTPHEEKTPSSING